MDKKASLVYLVMMVILTVGLWVILTFGSRFLKAPEDLAGKWKADLAAVPARYQSMTISQSGKFFRVIFDDGPQVDLQLDQSQSNAGQGAVSRVEMKLSGQGWSVDASGPEGSDDFNFVFSPPGGRNAAVSFHRTERLYASPDVKPPHPTTSPTTSPDART